MLGNSMVCERLELTDGLGHLHHQRGSVRDLELYESGV